MTDTDKPDYVEKAASALSLAGIRSGFSHYRKTYIDVLRYRGHFASNSLCPERSDTLSSAVSVFLYGVAIAFLFFLPLYYINDVTPDKTFFLLQFVYLNFIYLLVTHLAARIFGGRGTFRQTAGAYLTWGGIVIPTLSLAVLPALIFVGAPVEDFISGNAAVVNVESSSPPVWVTTWILIAVAIAGILGVIVLFRWLTDVHALSGWRLGLAYLVIVLPVLVIHQELVQPYAGKALAAISKMIHALL